MNGFRVLSLLVLVGLRNNLDAGALNVTVRDAGGAAVSDAVVYAQRNGATSGLVNGQAIIDQRDKQFVPYVTAVQVGTSITFPNSDNIRHHVYSFSPAKKFELPLYKGTPANPIVFSTAGS